MGRPKKIQTEAFTDSILANISSEEIEEVNASSIEDEEVSLIFGELEKYEKQINEIFVSLDSVDTLTIVDIEERLKAVKLKLEIQLKLPSLLSSLDDLRNKKQIKNEQIRGNKDLSPLEGGLLD